MSDAEIVRTLAEKVMKWAQWRDPNRTYEGWVVGMDGNQILVRRADSWNPLESISDAFQVVEKMRERGWQFCLIERQECWEAKFTRGLDVGEGYALTICRGICLAVLGSAQYVVVEKEKVQLST